MSPQNRLDQISEEINWLQPKVLKREYELRIGEQVAGTLRWQKGWGSLALAEWNSNQWTFKRVGFWQPRVTVRIPGFEEDTAIFRPNWNGNGTLELVAGRRLNWVATRFWRSEWSFLLEDGTELVRFRPKFGLATVKARLKVKPAAHAVPELPLLLLLGWYLLLLRFEDDAGATAATLTSIS
jgi:hypothetical protein